MLAAGVLGTGSYLPEEIITNQDLERIVDTSDAWIRERTGIRERRRAAEREATSDLCLEAARRALADAGVPAEEIDLIMVATVTPDMAFPATGCLVQDQLGAARAWAFDLEAGCSGFLYGLALGSQLIATGYSRYILLIGAETFSRIINWTDRNTCVLFGDGAGAVVMGPVPQGRGVLASRMAADGSGGKLLFQPAGGSRLPASEETVKERLHTIHMRGPEVFRFAVRCMEEVSLDVLHRCGLEPQDLDLFVPHQANWRIIDATRRRLGLPEDKVVVNLDRYGNMSSASIPVALDEARQQGRLREGDLVLLASFGAGFTWGAALLRWGRGQQAGNLLA
ncbi:MAG: beta-ketoacyl-ACP synthase III [Clostridia bacterium]|nr:ketoacyl-ACP synthase III [Clostridia bacterium]MDH7573894.1 beta-ketoacyl-ACP synthase III [Clostridia bacterium]